MLVVALILGCLASASALQCHNGTIWSVNNEVHNVPLTSKTCASTTSSCFTRYYHDGENFRYELGCDDSKLCTGVAGCKINGDPTRLCCCSGNDCVHSDASKPIDIAFPSGFRFSSATAAYQVEGGAFEDGKAPNIWDIYSHKAGRILMNHTGDVACDSYHQWQRDIEMLKEAGVHQYRFSLSWSRLLPDNDVSRPNRKGLEYYHNLIDGLLAANIEPVVTIFH